MYEDSVNLYTIYRETSNRLEVLRRRVQEGRDVMAASEFCRWLNFSGILELLKVNSRTGPLGIDGPLLDSKCRDLISACGDRFRTGDKLAHLETSQISSLHEKIDLMAGYLSRLTVPPSSAVSSALVEGAAVASKEVPFSELVLIPGGRHENVSQVNPEPVYPMSVGAV